MKFDYKLILITILLAGVIGMIIFWPSNENVLDKTEIERLHKENYQLIKDNSLLEEENNKKDSIIFTTNKDIVILENEVDELDSLIQNINNRRDETNDYINTLDDDKLIDGIADYIRRRKNRD